jgi:hypothetical protein
VEESKEENVGGNENQRGRRKDIGGTGEVETGIRRKLNNPSVDSYC